MTLDEIASRFDIPGRLALLTPTGSGNVNETYLMVFRTAFSEQRAILQKINRTVFSKPSWVMENLRTITEHAHRRLEREAARADRIWQLPRVIACKNRRDYFRDSAGDCWRALSLIASATSYDTVQGPDHAQESGAALGQFHRLVSDLKPARLHDTLAGFHNTPLYLKRYDATRRAQRAKHLLQASPQARALAQFIERRRARADVLENARARGELSVRIIHGDPKASNIMIDDLSGKATSIVDLDTVKPGLTQYDFGDALRSLCNPAGEETRDLGSVRFDPTLCAAFIKGYMRFARDFLTPHDKSYLYESVRLIAFELGLRFFEDHLAGNRYFKVRDARHNLRRAHVQLRLCEKIEAREKEIRAVLSEF